MQETAKKLADNTLGIVLARFVTPGLLAIALWLGSQFVARFDEALGIMRAQLATLDASLNAQGRAIAAIEAGRAASSKASEDDIAELTRSLNSLGVKVDAAVTQIATVTAKVEILLGQTNPGDQP